MRDVPKEFFAAKICAAQRRPAIDAHQTWLFYDQDDMGISQSRTPPTWVVSLFTFWFPTTATEKKGTPSQINLEHLLPSWQQRLHPNCQLGAGESFLETFRACCSTVSRRLISSDLDCCSLCSASQSICFDPRRVDLVKADSNQIETSALNLTDVTYKGHLW